MIDPAKALAVAVDFMDAIKDAYPTEDEQIGTYTLIVRCTRDDDGNSTVYVACEDHGFGRALLDTTPRPSSHRCPPCPQFDARAREGRR